MASRGSFLLLPLVLLGASARADEELPPAASCEAVSLGAARARALPVLDEKNGGTVAEWREAVLREYRACALAPFEVPTGLVDKGNAWSHELGRAVGAYRIRPQAAPPPRGAFEIFGVEVSGPAPKILEDLAALRELKAWPVKLSGEVVSGCRIELARATRAEICPALPALERAAPNAVSTQLRALVVCPAPLSAEELALVWLSPSAPQPLTSVQAERVASAADGFAGRFTTEDEATRDLSCTEGRTSCIGVSSSGGFLLERGPERKHVRILREELEGFELRGAPGRWVGVEHVPSGLRIARSVIGGYHGLPGVTQTRWWLAGGDCLLWQNRVRTKKYPARVELSSLCMAEGAWVEGQYALMPLQGEARQVAQAPVLDNVATRCVYSEAKEAGE